MTRLFGFVALAALLLGACNSEEEKLMEVRVAAASDLRAAFDEMEPDMERACSCDVVLVYGSSGLMREQIAAGADFGLYFSADENFVRSLIDEGHVVRDTARGYATGRLGLAWREGTAPLTDAGDLVRPDIQVVTIAQPAHAPYGRAAREAMQHHGVWEQVEPLIVFGENVRQTTYYVATGNADAGIVALSLTIGSDIPYVQIPGDEHEPLTQAAGVVIGIAEAKATRVLDYVTGSEGQALMGRYGFGPPVQFAP